MKTLYVLRHAKSSWTDPELADEDRPLAPRGQRAARQMAERLRQRHVAPALVLCSSARRARETLALVAAALSTEAQIQVEKELYAASAEELLERLRRIAERTASVMIVGHNPGLQDLVVMLAKPGGERERLREKFPAAALATLHIPTASWRDLDRGGAKLVDYVIPQKV